MGGSPEKVTVQGRRGVSVGSFCQLLEAGSLMAAAPAAPTASWIPDLHTGWEQLELGREMFLLQAIMQSDK